MRTKSTILDRGEKILLKIREGDNLLLEHNQLFLEVLIDLRNRLTFINSALQALNSQIKDINKGGDTDESKD